MESIKSKSNSQSMDNQKSKPGSKSSMPSSLLMKLFEDQLKDIYWAEKALTKAIPEMIKNANSAELIKAFKHHLSETETQIGRLEEIFKILDKKAVAVKCEAMAGLIKEAQEIMEDCEVGSMRDAGIISAGQKIEHYEIATYGTLRQFAETLQIQEATQLLEISLEEEKNADAKLSEIATMAINIHASMLKES